MAYWASSNQFWRNLDPASKAAAMALMEADLKGGKIDVDSARNALGAMINRAARDGVDIGEHVSGKIYQPTIEDAQLARLPKLVGSPEHQALVQAYNDRISGKAADWVNGATHFLAPESAMLALEEGNPNKYRSWREWTGYDDKTGAYKGVTFRDGSHAFLAPEGTYSAKFGDGDATFPVAAAPESVASAETTPKTDGGGLLGDLSQLGTFNSEGGTLTDALGFGGGLLAFGDALSKAQDGQAPQDPAQDDTQANPAEAAPRRPVDMRRVMAILQSRSRLGTA